MPLGEHGVSAQDCADHVWRALGPKINEHLRHDGLPEIAHLDAHGLPKGGIPVCLQARDGVLRDGPFISVVIATRDRPDLVIPCVRSVMASCYPWWEVIVVDNAPSTRTTADAVTSITGDDPRVRYLREDRPGVSWARNRGLIEAQGDIVAYTDDDVIVDPQWLAGVAHGFAAAEDVACVTGLVLPMELETPAQDWFEQFGGFGKGMERQMYNRRTKPAHQPLYPYAAAIFGTGANMAFKASVLREMGGFDPILTMGEDLGMFAHIVTGGFQLVYEPTAIVRHLHRREYAALQRQVYSYGAGLVAYALRCVTRDPRVLVTFLAGVPYILFMLLHVRSPKNATRRLDYPRELVVAERRGMLHGSFAYVRNWWHARRVRQHYGPLTVHPPTQARIRIVGSSEDGRRAGTRETGAGEPADRRTA